MYPDLYLYVERGRARELRAEAERYRLSRPAHAGAWRTRLGWAMVEAGLRLVLRRRVVHY
ncbi:hypothetical protein [Nonomuraea sp. NPDC002799]